MAHLAAGRIDAFWGHDLDSRNAAAGIVLLRESGALVEARDEAPLLLSRSMFACAPCLRGRFVDLLGAA
jgi:myo-inositol-1(or 4)-monophosphatase